MGSIEPNRDSRLSREGLNPSDVASDDEIVDIVSALVGLDRLQIRHVPHYRVLVEYSIGPVYIARHSSDLQCHIDVVHLGQGLSLIHI